MNDSTSDPIAEIRGVEVSPSKKIPFELYDKKSRKTTKLADLSNVSPMKGRHDWFGFEFVEPVFVSTIVVDAAGYDYKDCVFKWKSASTGDVRQDDTRFDDETFRITINDFITEFSFKPDRKYIGNPQIASVSAIGFTLSDFHEERGKIGKIAELRAAAVRDAQATISEASEAEARLEEIEAEIQERELEIKTLSTTQTTLESELKQWKEKIDSAERELATSRANIASLESRNETQEATIKQREAERDSLAKEIASKRAELKALENDIYLFPSELGEFAKRGGADKAFYWKLTAVPLLVLTAMAGALLLDAHNLAPILDENENARVFSIFVTRLPYVVVATAIIGAMYKIAKVLISEIIRIDTQTRGLAKLSIIATDVSAASEDGLDFSDEERYHLRTGLKMDLLREHLKSYIADSFDYIASDRIKSRLKFLERKRIAEAEVEDEVEGEEVVDETVAPTSQSDNPRRRNS
ncbi:hypothetical protein [Roseicyclus sp.]